MSAPHLMFVVTEDWYFVSHRLPLAVAARSAGYRVSVVTRVQQHERTLSEAGLQVIPWAHRRGGQNPVRVLRSIAALTRIYRRERPTIVHHVALEPSILGTMAARIARVPHVINAVAGMGSLYASRGGLARLVRPVVRQTLSVLFRHPSVVVVVQNPDDEELVARLGVPSGRLERVAGAGVDLALYPAGSEPPVDPLVVVLPARLLIDKGVREFVAAVRLLKARGVKLRAVLAGEPDPGNRASISQAEVQTWVREGVVEHAGWVRDMPSLLRACHLVCLPSYREGLPKSLLEAAAASRAIVTTDVPGCRSVVTHGDNGLLVPPRNAELLAEALQQLIANPALRAQMGNRGRERAEREWASSAIHAQQLALHARLLK